MPINSSGKGKRIERHIVSILNERFKDILSKNPGWGQFSRTVGSGNRWGQNVILSNTAKNVYTGDILAPECFKFNIECKGGYNHIDLTTAFESNKAINDFLNQANDDSGRNNKKPALIWKKDRKPEIVFLREKDISEYLPRLNYWMKYNEWVASRFHDILLLDDHYFFRMDNYD